MVDVFSKAKRSEVMARIRSKGNKDTELALARLLRASGITGWRRGQKLFGKPDFTWRAVRLALFVDGCFWHGCPRHCRVPMTRRDFWVGKINRNRTRDLLVGKTLRKTGWRVLRIWEHELSKNPARAVKRIREALAKPPPPHPEHTRRREGANVDFLPGT